MVNVNAQSSDYLFMIEQAVKAPSGHNTQPWLFRLNENEIQILPNFDKSLPAVDPDNRELFISLGCAAENLCIAASQKGYDTDLNISEEGIITIGYLIYNLAVLIPSLAVGVRRFHDIGKSGWNYFVGLIPLAGVIILLVWFCKNGQAGENKWGTNPKTNQKWTMKMH